MDMMHLLLQVEHYPVLILARFNSTSPRSSALLIEAHANAWSLQARTRCELLAEHIAARIHSLPELRVVSVLGRTR